MSVFFPFGIPTTSSYAQQAGSAYRIGPRPSYVAPYADSALYAPAGTPGANATVCPPGYENALNPSDPTRFPPVPSQAIDRSKYLLCFPTSSVPATSLSATPTPTPTITPTITPTATPAATPTVCYLTLVSIAPNLDNVCTPGATKVVVGTTNPTGQITTSGGYLYYDGSGCTTLMNSSTNYDDGVNIYIFNNDGTLNSTTPCSL